MDKKEFRDWLLEEIELCKKGERSEYTEGWIDCLIAVYAKVELLKESEE